MTVSEVLYDDVEECSLLYSTAGVPTEIVPYHLTFPSSVSVSAPPSRRVRASALEDDWSTPVLRSNAASPCKYFLLVTDEISEVPVVDDRMWPTLLNTPDESEQHPGRLPYPSLGSTSFGSESLKNDGAVTQLSSPARQR